MSEYEIVMKLPTKRQKNAEIIDNESIFVAPGDVISEHTDYMKGHGEYTNY